MTFETLQKKKEEKAHELQAISQKVAQKAKELSQVQRKIETAVARKSPDEAVNLTQQRRIIEDELQILQQVRQNIADEPAYTVYELQEAWQGVVSQCSNDVDALYPRLEKAYADYCEAVDALLSLRNGASQSGRALKLLATGEHIDFSPELNFKRKQFSEFWNRNKKKMWRHTGSHKNNPRPNHQTIDGQQAKKNERFELIGVNGNTYRPMYPGDTDLPPAERIHCHCISQPVVSSDIFGLTIEERKALQQQAIDDDIAAWEKELDAKNKAKAGIHT